MMQRAFRISLAGAILAAAAGCGPQPRQSSPPPATQAGAGTPVFQVPDDSLIPNDAVGESIRRGRALVTATRDSLPSHIGNQLRCASCHLDAGTRRTSSSWVGVYAAFPQYNKRSGRVYRIEDRINDCFTRSENGTALDFAGRDMADITAYVAFLSHGYRQGEKLPWLGLKKLELKPADAVAGGKVYVASCARCHGAQGQGGTWPSAQGTLVAPPVWGDKSYPIGAAMARLGMATSFVLANMPYDAPGTLTEQQAFDVAAFVLSHPRADTKGKEKDWPKGGKPDDVPYSTLSPATAQR